MGGGQEGAIRSLKPFKARPILRAKLDSQVQLIALIMLVNHFAPRMKPGDAGPIAGVESDIMGL